MSLIRDAEAEKLIMKAASKLEGMEQMKPPVWSSIVKTGMHKERPPEQKNWWWIRSASVLRKIYLSNDEAVGVSKLRKVYGGKKNRGHKPEHKFKASGAIIRKVLQQLEAAELVKTEKGKGRVVTAKGRALLNGAVKELRKA